VLTEARVVFVDTRARAFHGGGAFIPLLSLPARSRQGTPRARLCVFCFVFCVLPSLAAVSPILIFIHSFQAIHGDEVVVAALMRD